ncbi:MAG: hypothetical protein CVT92_11860 [Bacteroidetes bacterium HGW-Bacteroidetes-1]|nr:MAG: hypothetical protein CVT92_11860 [Bacteroidetes bacterium HGW-Bacteroidetes-1]
MKPSTLQPILLFDGECALCNKAVIFVLRYERKPIILFASLQSSIGQEIIADFFDKRPFPDSLILIENGHVFLRSDAAIRIAILMGGFMKILGLFRIIPRAIRDYIYDVVARNRKRMFGSSKHCMLRPDIDRQRFLDSF